jgi:hypothetical protein
LSKSLGTAGILTAQEPARCRRSPLFLHNEEAERVWVNDPAFWQAYADDLARCHYNRSNLIYGHQSPYLVWLRYRVDDTWHERRAISSVDRSGAGREGLYGCDRLRTQRR